jgi:hypothetical protein
LQINTEASKADPCVIKVKNCIANSRALLAATENVETAAHQLARVAGAELTLAGQPYPSPGALRKVQLLLTHDAEGIKAGLTWQAQLCLLEV